MKVSAYGGTKITDLVEIPKITGSQIGSWEISHDNDGEMTRESPFDALENLVEVISERAKDKIYKEISEEIKKISYKR